MRERSSGSLEMKGRVKVTVVIPFSCVAMALVMSWLASIGGWERAIMFLHVHGRWEKDVTPLTLIHSFIHSFIHSLFIYFIYFLYIFHSVSFFLIKYIFIFIYPFIHTFIYLFVYLFVYLLTLFFFLFHLGSNFAVWNHFPTLVGKHSFIPEEIHLH